MNLNQLNANWDCGTGLDMGFEVGTTEYYDVVSYATCTTYGYGERQDGQRTNFAEVTQTTENFRNSCYNEGLHSQSKTIANVDCSEKEYDNIAPTGVVSYSTSDWTNGDITVTVTCEDDISGCVKEEYEKTVSVNGTGSIQISDEAGNTSDIDYTVANIDNNAPSGKVSYSPSSSTNGDVIVSVSCTDTETGCEQSTYTGAVSENGSGHITISDKAGNTSNISYYVNNIDKDTPNITFDCNNNSENTNGYVSCTLTGNNDNIQSPETMSISAVTQGGVLPNFNEYSYVQYSLKCGVYDRDWKGRIRGCRSYIKPTQTYYFSNNGTYTVTGNISDLAGNKANSISKTFKIDTSSPSINTKEALNLWYNKESLKDLTFDIKDQNSSTDQHEETGLDKISATFNGNSIPVNGFQKTNNVDSIQIHFTKLNLIKFIKEGTKNELKISITDKVGHTTIGNYNIKYDNTKPKLITSDINNSWNNSNIKISLGTYDDNSGIAQSKYSWVSDMDCIENGTAFYNEMNIILSKEGEHTLYLCNQDYAGNTYSTKFGTYKLDKTPPTGTYSYSPDGWTNGNVTVKVDCKDEQSGCKEENVDYKYNKTVSQNGTGGIIITDNVGNKSIINYNITNIDKEAPQGKVSYSTKDWTNGNVTVTVTCSDGQSGCGNKPTYSKTVSQNGSGTILITDNANNISYISYVVNNIDKQVPNLEFNCDNSGESTQSNVECTMTGNNEGIQSLETMGVSGETDGGILPEFKNVSYLQNMLACKEYKTNSTECLTYRKPILKYRFTNNGTYYINGEIFDSAGNKSQFISKTFKIDTSSPSIDTDEDFNFWYNNESLKDLTFNMRDQRDSTNQYEEAGLVSVSAELNNNSIQVIGFQTTNNIDKTQVHLEKLNLIKYIKESAENVLKISTTDKVGHTTTSTYYIKYDNTIPTLNILNKNVTWKNSDIDITLTSYDEMSGIDESKYSWKNDVDCIENGTEYDNKETITLSTEGEHTLYICNKDSAGNTNTSKFGTYKLDKTLPTLNILNPIDTWENSDISIELETQDDRSGIDTSKYSWKNDIDCIENGTDYDNGETIILSTEGEHTLYICNKDIAGNTNTSKFGTYKLDKTVPTLDVYNKDYTWTNSDIIIKLNTSDDSNGIILSKLNYSKYIWNDDTNCESNGINYVNDQEVILSTDIEGEHTLYICNEDNAGNQSTSNYGTYKIDKTNPTLEIGNTDNTWKNADIKIELATDDDRSGVDYSKYIWDNSTTCHTLGAEYENTNEITLSDEGEHTLYICNKDIAGNTNDTTFGTYKLDKTYPTIDLTIPDVTLANDDNFEVAFKLFDNLNGIDNLSSYTTYDVSYNYTIEADTKSDISNGDKKSNIKTTDTYSLTDASEKNEKFKINFTFSDKAGNETIVEKEFVIYPNYFDDSQSLIEHISTITPYANNLDTHAYKLTLKDKYSNNIYTKNLTKVNQENNLAGSYGYTTIVTDDGSDALLEINNKVTDENGQMTFSLKSLSPGEFMPIFKLSGKKWGNNYQNLSTQDSIYLTTGSNNTFLKPFIGKLVVSDNDGDTYDTKPKFTGNNLKYKLELSNPGNIDSYTSGKTSITDNTITQTVPGHYWKVFENISNNFDDDFVKYLGFEATIDATDNILQGPKIESENLTIEYELLGKKIKYNLGENTEINNSELKLEGTESLDTIGLKVEGTVQGDGKSELTGQEYNFSDLSKISTRGVIRKNGYMYTKNRTSGSIVNGIKYVIGDINIGGEIDGAYETLIVKDGNITITSDLNTSGHTLGIILLKDNYVVKEGENQKGNIYIENNVQFINAIIYADGGLMSDGSGNKQLVMKGSLFTRNTIGGAIKGPSLEYILPGGETTGDQSEAKIYDLNYLRIGNDDLVTSENKDNTENFVIIYNAGIQNNPPKGFTNQ